MKYFHSKIISQIVNIIFKHDAINVYYVTTFRAIHTYLFASFVISNTLMAPLEMATLPYWGPSFADGNSKSTLLNKDICIWNIIWMKYVPYGQIDNN